MASETFQTATPREAPISRLTAIALFALAIGSFAIGTAEFAAMALLPYFSAELGVDAATAAHAISAYALGVVVGAPVLAVAGARMSRRKLLILLMGFYAVSNIATAFVPDYNAMLLFRFISGFPHGAYFGVAALVGASLVPQNRRTQAVALIMIGLTIATVVGVPLSNILGQYASWRLGFALSGAIAALCAVLVFFCVPHDPPRPDARPMRELSVLGNRQVWLTLLTGAVGTGGFFAVYTYVASTLQTVTGAHPGWIPVMLALMGIGMTLGTLGAGWAADRMPVKSAYFFLFALGIMLVIYPSTTGSVWLMAPALFLIGSFASLGTILQTRLMDVAGDAQTLAAALNHSAFNAANALGPWLASLAVAAGWGFPSSGYVGACLSVVGIAIFTLTIWDARRRHRW